MEQLGVPRIRVCVFSLAAGLLSSPGGREESTSGVQGPQIYSTARPTKCCLSERDENERLIIFSMRSCGRASHRTRPHVRDHEGEAAPTAPTAAGTTV